MLLGRTLRHNLLKRFTGGIGRTLMKFDDGFSGIDQQGSILPERTWRQKNLKNVEVKGIQASDSRLYRGIENCADKSTELPPSAEISSKRHWPQGICIGYAAGAYDLFHIGHLNILRQAKKSCDYLIAGVVSDEMLRKYKGIEPFIPESERLAIVQSIEFVDEAILEDLPDKLDTWNVLRFNVFFKGDDWRGTAKGQDLEERFGKVGVSVEYLPYTLHTSSTKLRMALDNLEGIARRQ